MDIMEIVNTERNRHLSETGKHLDGIHLTEDEFKNLLEELKSSPSSWMYKAATWKDLVGGKLYGVELLYMLNRVK